MCRCVWDHGDEGVSQDTKPSAMYVIFDDVNETSCTELYLLQVCKGSVLYT